MTVSVPVVLIFGILVYVAYQYKGMRAWHAVVAVIFGFLLAGSAFSPEIRNFLAGLSQWLNRP